MNFRFRPGTDLQPPGKKMNGKIIDEFGDDVVWGRKPELTAPKGVS